MVCLDIVTTTALYDSGAAWYTVDCTAASYDGWAEEMGAILVASGDL